MGGRLADNKCLIFYFNRFFYFHMVVVMSRDTDIHYSFGPLSSHLDTKRGHIEYRALYTPVIVK